MINKSGYLPCDFLQDMVGRGLPSAAQSMTAILWCSTVTSRGSSSHRGDTAHVTRDNMLHVTTCYT